MIARAGEPIRWLGLDIGQLQDYSALAIVEQVGDTRGHYTVRHLQRWSIGTIYPAIVAELVEMWRRPELARAATKLVADATGVGRPVIDLLGVAGIRPVAVTITSGFEPVQVPARRTTLDEWRVPKRELVATLQVLLQQRRFAVADGLEHGQLLREELLNFRAKIKDSGHEALEAWRESDHDDLVLAVAVATWYAEHVDQVTRRKQPTKPMTARVELRV